MSEVDVVVVTLAVGFLAYLAFLIVNGKNGKNREIVYVNNQGQIQPQQPVKPPEPPKPVYKHVVVTASKKQTESFEKVLGNTDPPTPFTTKPSEQAAITFTSAKNLGDTLEKMKRQYLIADYTVTETTATEPEAPKQPTTETVQQNTTTEQAQPPKEQKTKKQEEPIPTQKDFESITLKPTV